jgi:FkbM family methyltransferase
MPGDIIFDRPPVRARMCKHGAVIYFSTDSYIGRSFDLYGEYSEGEIEMFRQIVQPGMTVLDVGANIGAFTLFFAKAVGEAGRVHAFEPQRTLYHVLCGNLALNALSNVTAIHGALADKPGTLFVRAVDYAKPGNFGGLALDPAAVSQGAGENVGVSTIDALGLERCDFVKIDVEGMERDVLQGAADTLARCKPFLFVENDREDKSAALISWLFEHDYRAYWHLSPLFNPNNHFGASENAFGGTTALNMLCVPRSMQMRVALHELVSPQEGWREADRIAPAAAVRRSAHGL